jgi:DNA repair protein RadC
METHTTRKLLLAGDEDTIATEDLWTVLLQSRGAARQIALRYPSLGSVEECEPRALTELPGVGPRRAALIRAVFAVARRRGWEPPFRGTPVECSEDVYALMHPLLRHERREVLMVLALDARHRLVRSPINAAVGSLTQAVVEPRDLLRPLIVAAAAAAILTHNHPSSCPEPSAEDVALSRSLFEACSLVGIRLLDHVVVSDGAYVSLADRGLL